MNPMLGMNLPRTGDLVFEVVSASKTAFLRLNLTDAEPGEGHAENASLSISRCRLKQHVNNKSTAVD